MNSPSLLFAPRDDVEYMVRVATSRRQLRGSQRAAIAVELADYHAERERGRACQHANLRNSPLDVEAPPPRESCTRDRYAKTVGVSGRTVQVAHTIHQHNPGLFEQIKRGRLSVSKAIKEFFQRGSKTSTPA